MPAYKAVGARDQDYRLTDHGRPIPQSGGTTAFRSDASATPFAINSGTASFSTAFMVASSFSSTSSNWPIYLPPRRHWRLVGLGGYDTGKANLDRRPLAGKENFVRPLARPHSGKTSGTIPSRIIRRNLPTPTDVDHPFRLLKNSYLKAVDAGQRKRTSRAFCSAPRSFPSGQSCRQQA